MKILNHKNILQLYEIIETRTHTFLIYEYFQGMKLSDYIIKKKKLSEDESFKIYKKLLSALSETYLLYKILRKRNKCESNSGGYGAQELQDYDGCLCRSHRN